MKTAHWALCIFVAVGLLAVWLHHEPEPPPVIAPPASPTPKPPRLAPAGIYYTLEYVSSPTKSGVIGFTPGQQLRLMEVLEEAHWLMSDGKYSVEVDPAVLTNDLDIAASAAAGDNRAQATLAAQRAAEAAEAHRALMAQQAPTSPAVRPFSRTYRYTSRSASTPANPLDREATQTNHGRQVTTAPKVGDFVIPIRRQ